MLLVETLLLVQTMTSLPTRGDSALVEMLLLVGGVVRVPLPGMPFSGSPDSDENCRVVVAGIGPGICISRNKV